MAIFLMKIKVFNIVLTPSICGFCSFLIALYILFLVNRILVFKAIAFSKSPIITLELQRLSSIPSSIIIQSVTLEKSYFWKKPSCTTVACLPPIRGLKKCRVIGLVEWPVPFSQSQASNSVFLFPEEHG